MAEQNVAAGTENLPLDHFLLDEDVVRVVKNSYHWVSGGHGAFVSCYLPWAFAQALPQDARFYFSVPTTKMIAQVQLGYPSDEDLIVQQEVQLHMPIRQIVPHAVTSMVPAYVPSESTMAFHAVQQREIASTRSTMVAARTTSPGRGSYVASFNPPEEERSNSLVNVPHGHVVPAQTSAATIGILHEDHESSLDRKPAGRVTVDSISSASEEIVNGIMTNKIKRLRYDDTRSLDDHIATAVPGVVDMVVQNVPPSPDRQDWMCCSTVSVEHDSVRKNTSGDVAPGLTCSKSDIVPGVTLASAASVTDAVTGMVQGPSKVTMTHDDDKAARQTTDGARTDDVSMTNRHAANGSEWI
jgi:hypothetical protein